MPESKTKPTLQDATALTAAAELSSPASVEPLAIRATGQTETPPGQNIFDIQRQITIGAGRKPPTTARVVQFAVRATAAAEPRDTILFRFRCRVFAQYFGVAPLTDDQLGHVQALITGSSWEMPYSKWAI